MDQGTGPILEMRAISKTFPGVKALQDVSLAVRTQEIHAICGENGAGKSTLMKVLSGVYPVGTYEGDILFEGQPCSFGSINDSEHAGIVIIHQELALVPYLSVAENIFLGNEQRGRSGLIDWHKTNAEAAKLLARVGLHENPVTPVGQLGVGKQQLIEIAKALSKDVKLLILDEPTAALNDTDSEHLLGLLRQLRDQGMTCIIISHKLNEITSIADTTTVIRDGKTVVTLDMAAEQVTQERIIKAMVGRDLESRFPDRTSSPGEEVLRIEDWTVWHPVQDSGPRHRLRDRGPQEVRPEPHRRHPPQRVGRCARQALARWVGERPRGDLGGRAEPQEHEHQGTDRHVGGGQAVGRQPAEGRAEQVALHRPGGPHPRRADPRHRRRRQVRDLRDHQPAGGGGQGGHRHLVRAA
jgi:ABC-type branched-subunit amino acid transport system ATPase component